MPCRHRRRRGRADVSSVRAPDRNRRGSALYAAAQDLQTAGKRRTLKASRRSMTRPHSSGGRGQPMERRPCPSRSTTASSSDRDAACDHALSVSVRGTVAPEMGVRQAGYIRICHVVVRISGSLSGSQCRSSPYVSMSDSDPVLRGPVDDEVLFLAGIEPPCLCRTRIRVKP